MKHPFKENSANIKYCNHRIPSAISHSSSMITMDVHTPRSELAMELEDDESSDEEEIFDMASALVHTKLFL